MHTSFSSKHPTTILSLLYKKLPYILLIIHTLFLIPPCFWFAQDLNFIQVRSFDDWYLSSLLSQTCFAFKNGKMLAFFKGLFNISYGPVFWGICFIVAYPFFLLNSQAGFLIINRFVSLFAGFIAWIFVVRLINRYINALPILVILSLLPGLLCSQILQFQTSIHPDTLAIASFIATIFCIMRDREQPQQFSHFFTYALAMLCFGIAIKFNTFLAGIAPLTHVMIYKEQYSWPLFKKNCAFVCSLSTLLHLPMLLNYEIFKFYLSRFLFLSQKAKDLGNWEIYWRTVGERINAFNDWLFPVWFFIFLAGICLYFLWKNKEKLFTNHAAYLFGISSSLFISHGVWVLCSNHVIWIHYALIACFLMPIILTFCTVGISSYKHRQFSFLLHLGLFIPTIAATLCLSQKAKLFATMQNDPGKIAYASLLTKINTILRSTNHEYSVVAATPTLGISPYSTTKNLEIRNVRTKNHFENLEDVEAIVMHKNFILHDTEEILAIDFIQNKPFMKLFTLYYDDDQVTVFIKNEFARNKN